MLLNTLTHDRAHSRTGSLVPVPHSVTHTDDDGSLSVCGILERNGDVVDCGWPSETRAHRQRDTFGEV